jgi:hypothetical protein
LTTPSFIRFSREQRKTLERVRPTLQTCAKWYCTGCGSNNLTRIDKSRLAKCACGKVVVLVQRRRAAAVEVPR